jgi:hypothetical protein
MSCRVRILVDKQFYVLNDKVAKNNASVDFWTYKEVHEGVVATKSENGFKYSYITDTTNNKIIRKRCIDNYSNNVIFNKTEELNKGHYYYIPYLIELAKERGYTITYDEYNKELDNAKCEYKKKTVILNTPDITMEHYRTYLQYQREGKATEEQKMAVERKTITLEYGVDTLDETIMDNFYRNEGSVRNLTYLIDEDNLIKRQENKMVMNNISKEDFAFEERIEQVKIMKQLLLDLGFTNIFEDKYLTRAELLQKFDYLVKNNRIYTDTKRVNQIFGLKKFASETTSCKAILGYLNSSFFNRYGLALKNFSLTKSKKSEDAIYKIIQLNNIAELIGYKMDRGLALYDRNKIFQRPTVLMYSHLITKKDDDDENDDDEEDKKIEVDDIIETVDTVKVKGPEVIDYLHMSINSIYEYKVKQLQEIGAEFDEKEVLKNIKSVYDDEDICDEDKLEAYTNVERFKKGKIFVI